MKVTRDQLKAWAQRRKATEATAALRNRVSYDERILDYLTAEPESVKPSEADLVVARLPDGAKTRVGSLLAVVKGYGNIFPVNAAQGAEGRHRERCPGEGGAAPQAGQVSGIPGAGEADGVGGLYQHFYQHYIAAQATVSDSEVAAYLRAHPEAFPARELTPEVATNIRSQLSAPRQKERFQALVADLRQKTKITIDEKLLAALKLRRRPGSEEESRTQRSKGKSQESEGRSQSET